MIQLEERKPKNKTSIRMAVRPFGMEVFWFGLFISLVPLLRGR
ncbi:hypothetical protein HMPREF9413_5531 [Paenibacillus sp. HGF7]|nr:hypothetical protein HMPREF9413_5531 [Paenibacillus sp. HGF7]